MLPPVSSSRGSARRAEPLLGGQIPYCSWWRIEWPEGANLRGLVAYADLVGEESCQKKKDELL